MSISQHNCFSHLSHGFSGHLKDLLGGGIRPLRPPATDHSNELNFLLVTVSSLGYMLFFSCFFFYFTINYAQSSEHFTVKHKDFLTWKMVCSFSHLCPVPWRPWNTVSFHWSPPPQFSLQAPMKIIEALWHTYFICHKKMSYMFYLQSSSLVSHFIDFWQS